MQDSYDRTIDYIRISVTDQCNLRCIYCMPEGCIQKVPKQMLNDDQILMLCRCFAQLGVSRVKITGGEPLLRPQVPLLIKEIRQIPGIRSVTLTTNGILLKKYLPQLVKAGLTGVNISIDSLNSAHYQQISGRDRLLPVMDSLKAALSYPELVTKLNCVPVYGKNHQDLADLALLAKDQDLHVRFIEMMPIGYGKDFTCCTEDQILMLLEKKLHTQLIPYEGSLGNGPAHYYQAQGFKGKIGFISAVSHKFCSQCNRIRLTSDGYLKTCLQYRAGCDLMPYLQKGASEETLKQMILKAVKEKPMCHHFLEEQKDERKEKEELRAMCEIGG